MISLSLRPTIMFISVISAAYYRTSECDVSSLSTFLSMLEHREVYLRLLCHEGGVIMNCFIFVVLS